MKKLLLFTLLAILAVLASATDLKLFFGNPHSHTAYSDGTGTPEEAFAYASRVPNLDFLAVTDHGYYFVQELPDGRNKFTATIEAARKATREDFLAFAGFEWTATGTGHMNVYGTEDWTDRVRSDLWHLYDWIIERGALAQFNHPITMFGDNFKEFYYVPEADLYVNLIEVGNGNWWQNETISAEMFEAFRLALLKGWHIGTTVGQDNHKPNWGGANDSRTAVYATGLSEEEILGAFMRRRTYGTEDKSIILYFATDEGFMGDILYDLDTVTLKIRVEDDPNDPFERVEVYSKNGVIASFDTTGPVFETELTLSIESGYECFFVYVTGRDGEEAVSSPIWIQRSHPVHLYNPSVFPSNVKPGEEVTLSFQISNVSSAVAASTLKLGNSSGVVHSELLSLERYESKIINMKYVVGEDDSEISMLLDDTPYASVLLNIRKATSLNVLLDKSHVNFAMDRRNALSSLLQDSGHKFLTAERVFKAGDLDTVDILLLPLPGAGGTFERLKMLMAIQKNIIIDFVLSGGTLIITGTGEEAGTDIINSYNSLLEELGVPLSYAGVKSDEVTAIDGIVYDGISEMTGKSGEYAAGDGLVIILPGDPFTDRVIEFNIDLLNRLF